MARSGHTGTLPTLLARMNQEAQGKYVDYLPKAQEANYARRMGIAGARTAGLSNLFSPYMNAVGQQQAGSYGGFGGTPGYVPPNARIGGA